MNLLRKWRCPHSNLSGIYGDEINLAGGYRLWCKDCHRLLDGPAKLLAMREGESE